MTCALLGRRRDVHAARNSSYPSVMRTSKLSVDRFRGGGAIHAPEDIEGDIE